MDDVVGWTGGSRFQAVPILEIQVKTYERFQEWSQGEAFAYRTIRNRLTLRVKDQMAERGSSRELWNQLKERYDRGELAAYCEIFAQLKETTGDMYSRSRNRLHQQHMSVVALPHYQEISANSLLSHQHLKIRDFVSMLP